jgi:hypothetical protein
MSILQKKKKKSTQNHYFDNETFRETLKEYYNSLEGSKVKEIKERELCESLFSLCKHLSSSGNFWQYSWKDEFVADAVNRCWKAVVNKKFDLERVDENGHYLKPFSYFSCIASREFIKIIKKEKKNVEEMNKYKSHVFSQIIESNGFENYKRKNHLEDEEDNFFENNDFYDVDNETPEDYHELECTEE